jgi:hypothetical protein
VPTGSRSIERIVWISPPEPPWNASSAAQSSVLSVARCMVTRRISSRNNSIAVARVTLSRMSLVASGVGGFARHVPPGSAG